VFVAGGEIGSSATNTTRIFNRAEAQFTAGPSIPNTGMYWHTATLLSDGSVYLTNMTRSR